MKKFWQIKNEADTDSAELLLYGEISDVSWFGDEVTPTQFADDLKALEGKDLTVRVNSPGGDVFAAHAIYNQMKAYAGHITMQIDGLAASAATIITCAGDKVIMPDNALFMIHNPKGALMGYFDAKSLKAYTEQLDVVKETIVNVYKKRCKNLTDTQLRHKMDDETWMTAQEAFDYGFVDEIDIGASVTNSIKDGMLVVNSVACDLSRFKRGDKVAEILNKKGEESVNNKDLLDKIKSLLGVTADEPEPIEDSAVTAERERIAALDALDDHTSAAVTKMVNIAKENGTTAEQIKPFIDAVREDTKDESVLDAIRALIKDEMTSGASNVAPSAAPASEDDDKKASIDEVVNLANKKRG